MKVSPCSLKVPCWPPFLTRAPGTDTFLHVVWYQVADCCHHSVTLTGSFSLFLAECEANCQSVSRQSATMTQADVVYSDVHFTKKRRNPGESVGNMHLSVSSY